MLQSPRYGQRWAQHWLDVIRWAETAGFETNAPRSTAWPYRDWLIESLNADKPYDQFVFEQVAGDTVGQDAALGFLVAGPANLPGQIGRDEESMRQARQDELDEVIRTVSQPFLGLTIGCARCHSHKFDPLSASDYYSFQAIFAGLRYGERRLRGSLDDAWQAQVPDVERQVRDLENRLESLRRSLNLQSAVSDIHEERFEPVSTTAVRMEIKATGNGQPASLYEFEVWTAAAENSSKPENIALQGKASASGFALENQSRHPDNLNDGTVDARQAFPWRSDKPGPAWIQVDLPAAAKVERIVWYKGYSVPADAEISVRTTSGTWQEVAHTRDCLPRLDDTRGADAVSLDQIGGESLSLAEISELIALIAELRAARLELARLSNGPQVFAAHFTAPEPTWVLRRGDAMQRGKRIGPGVPRALGSVALDLDAPDEQRRIALGRFLGSASNPLTARVIVNRIWQHHFGTGIVDTPSDFGKMGSRPTHPELLDWLATELIENGWSLKHIHRLILSSSTFRQSSAPSSDALAIDADSRLLWRFPPRRLDGEALRDSVLLASGKLNDAMGGPGFDFFNQKGGLSDYVAKETFDAAGWRRMIYATKIRMQAVDIFGAFDCPDAGQMTPRRTRSITPVQALNLLNSPFVNRQAEFMARRIQRMTPAGTEQVRSAVELALNRAPDHEELMQLTELARRHGLRQVCRVLMNANEFVLLQ